MTSLHHQLKLVKLTTFMGDEVIPMTSLWRCSNFRSTTETRRIDEFLTSFDFVTTQSRCLKGRHLTSFWRPKTRQIFDEFLTSFWRVWWLNSPNWQVYYFSSSRNEPRGDDPKLSYDDPKSSKWRVNNLTRQRSDDPNWSKWRVNNTNSSKIGWLTTT